ncbi:MAG: NAD(P)H-quinone oxidoreductase [Acidobacteria bacterium]|nr:NAD(P)H-quinone oxidoreductase [Acidobacteriota bacterium]
MNAVEISRPGGPEVLRPVERPDPRPAPGEILVRVAAAGVNRPDVMQRQGKYPPPPGASDIPGLEIAGTVVDAHGSNRWHNGDQVCALVAGGGYAEICAVPEPQALPIPPGLSLVEAAGVPETFFTVWANVFERGRLSEGETLLVHGGTSGIGTTAIQLARARGARVIATAGSDDKVRACVEIGAAAAINYRTDDFVARTRELTDGRGADLILDIVAGDYIPRNLDALALDGRLVVIGMQGGAKALVNFVGVLQKRLTITGSTLRARSIAEKGRLAREVERHLWPLLASGAVKPLIHATFPLERAADAHRMLEAGAHVGKIVLVLDERF